MVKLFKVHKYSGIVAGAVLFMLAVSGFLLNHKNFSFLFNTHFKTASVTLLEKESRVFESFWIDKEDEKHIIVAGWRGLYEKKEGVYHKIFAKACLDILYFNNRLYIATEDGIYTLTKGLLSPFALQGEFINALSVSDHAIIAVIDKRSIVHINEDGKIVKIIEKIAISKEQLQHDITLSRLVRDIHYGRGVFDGVVSLCLNDYSAFYLAFLALSGYIIYLLIRLKKQPKISRKLIKLHANSLVFIAMVPLVLLALTGILLDHANFFRDTMKKIIINHSYLPPVYHRLSEDIFCIDYYEGVYSVGNRYGVYESTDLNTWQMVSKGFAYRMNRIGEILYVSAMGAPNRQMKNHIYTIDRDAPHMYKDLHVSRDKTLYLAHHSDIALPKFNSISLYTLMLSLHDGSFFSPYWIWINDIASLLLIILLFTGVYRYARREIKIRNS